MGFARAGEMVGYLGPNGAGKSTTVKMITGMIRANNGKVLFEGRAIRDDLGGVSRVLGYVPEEAHVYTYSPGSSICNWWGGCAG